MYLLRYYSYYYNDYKPDNYVYYSMSCSVLNNTMYGNFHSKFGITVLLFKLNEENCYGTTVYNFDKFH